tara:strand:+ start:309 stop:1001 length:693 start_codon:yes stop_codon:yes gene_type:complete
MNKLSIIAVIVLYSANTLGIDKYRMNDQFFIFDHLYNFFKTNSELNNEKLNSILNKNIIRFPHYFGVSCNLNDSRVIATQGPGANTHLRFKVIEEDKKFACKQGGHIDVNFHSNYNTIRAGLTIKSCTEIFFPELHSESEGNVSATIEDAIGPYVASAMEKLCPNLDECYFSKDVILKSVQVFYPFIGNLKDDFYTKVYDNHGDESTDTAIDKIKIKHFLYSLCIDPNWH